jgi:hypothetical protein
MLDEFDDDGKTASTAAGGKSSEQPPLDEEWARMLQEGMADLLKDVDQPVRPSLRLTGRREVLIFSSQRCRGNSRS